MRNNIPQTISRFNTRIRQLHSTPNKPPLILQLWGSNTNVGKTVLSAGLLRASNNPSLFLKPVQTGYPADDDCAAVKAVAKKAQQVALYMYAPPVSPDLAASLTDHVVSDKELCSRTSLVLHDYFSERDKSNDNQTVAIVETAGGVLSPAPSASLQADVYRPLRFPAVLVGDGALGGVSATLTAYEALRMRGYDIPAVVLFANEDEMLENEVSIQRHVQKETSVFRAPKIPSKDVALEDYLCATEVSEFFAGLLHHFHCVESERFEKLGRMKEESKRTFWYPFTQHGKLKDVTCIDSAHGDMLTCYDGQEGLRSMVDGIGSWWTNGVGHGNSGVSKAVGNACGRYGHVMFAGGSYEPALELAKKLLKGPGNGWASRVFFSDDGSTAMEVALKMGFRKRWKEFPDRRHLDVKIVGLEGSYHGDTLGVMNCSQSSDFNSLQTPWYRPNGVFFKPVTVSIKNGVWSINRPDWLGMEESSVMGSWEEAMCLDTDQDVYGLKIGEQLDEVIADGKIELGALVMEPVVLGAGGMSIVQAGFQKSLVEECRKRKIAIIFDEVFTGLWRLGCESGAEIIGCEPDIAAYSKLLTGGTVPLAATLATEEVFSCFEGETLREGLLHGHSYTGHAMGCAAAVESLEQYEAAGVGKRRYWNEGHAREISCLADVEEVGIIGTVLAVKMKGKEEGYGATGAIEIVKRLGNEGVFARPLGNVIYVMCSPVTEEDVCTEILRKLSSVLFSSNREIRQVEI